MSKKIDAKDLGIDDDSLNEDAVNDKINTEALIFRQIERTAQSAIQDESIFAANVRILLSMIQASKRDDIQNRQDEYQSTESHYEYKMFCGVPLGTPDNPINGSPFAVTNDVIDWHKIFEMILASLEESGIMWKRQNNTIETGLVDEKTAKIKPTPVLSDTPIKEAEQPIIQNTPTPKAKVKKQPTCGCGSCNKEKVTPGTGTHYKGVLILKEHLDRAKLNFANSEKGIRKN